MGIIQNKFKAFVSFDIIIADYFLTLPFLLTATLLYFKLLYFKIIAYELMMLTVKV